MNGDNPSGAEAHSALLSQKLSFFPMPQKTQLLKE
jgi:hypothetical protein